MAKERAELIDTLLGTIFEELEPDEIRYFISQGTFKLAQAQGLYPEVYEDSLKVSC